MSARTVLRAEQAWAIAGSVLDPELPVLSLADLGVLRGVVVAPEGTVQVRITPTYLGCPAVETMASDLVAAFAEHGVEAHVETVWSPPWTTDAITPTGLAALRAAGIAPPTPPDPSAGGATALTLAPTRYADPACPQCGAERSRLVSRSGPTACTSLWVCGACEEPYEHVRTLR
ncbi:1,2-phenylacetyl-CoA epoxidase subunit PaaD [Nocardioides massiliensis]|uniref:Ring-1,2-phenylacetyl-CoA epoxidase subunit PaaD n=1 Tax=Nocardioides massiliensis TaxID=1325935 RepID=A0ABT9NQD4_9ACTN|nr:1,2-phenylacetyl-CoA epoxidase subunit PaaD [Nocardioides massiliensis]MDP9822640.1 ring-1,2-phenylacetyl-CoA epoxidase subunit PaaD [Nocardioides massiliensis]